MGCPAVESIPVLHGACRFDRVNPGLPGRPGPPDHPRSGGSTRVGPGQPGLVGLSPGSTRVERVILGPLGHPEPVGSSHANPGFFSRSLNSRPRPARPPGFQPDQPATRVNPEKTPGPTHFFPRLRAKLDVPVRRVVRLSMFANTCIMVHALAGVARIRFSARTRPAPRGIRMFTPMFVHVCACTNVFHSPLYAPILSVRFPALRLDIGAPCTLTFARTSVSPLTHPERD